MLASTDSGSEVAIWDGETGALVNRFQAYFDTGDHGLYFAPDGASLLAVSYTAGVVTRWGVRDGAFQGELPMTDVDSFRSALPSPDQRTLAVGVHRKENGGSLVLMDLSTGEPSVMYRALPDGGWVVLTPGGEIDGPPHVLEKYLAR